MVQSFRLMQITSEIKRTAQGNPAARFRCPEIEFLSCQENSARKNQTHGTEWLFCQRAGDILVERKIRIVLRPKQKARWHNNQRARFLKGMEERLCSVRQQTAVFIEEIGDELILTKPLHFQSAKFFCCPYCPVNPPKQQKTRKPFRISVLYTGGATQIRTGE